MKRGKSAPANESVLISNTGKSSRCLVMLVGTQGSGEGAPNPHGLGGKSGASCSIPSAGGWKRVAGQGQL